MTNLITTLRPGVPGEYILKAIETARTFDVVKIRENHKDKSLLTYVKVGNAVVPYSATYANESDLTIKGVDVDLKRFQANFILEHAALMNLPDASNYVKGFADIQSSEALTAALTNYFAPTVANNVENIFWGATAGTSNANGLTGIIPLAKADVDTTKITAITASFTVSNILAEVDKVVNALPARLLEYANTKVFMNYKDWLLLKQAYGKEYNIYFGQGTTSNVNRFFYQDNIEMIPVSAPLFTSKTMVACDPDQIAFATDKMSDMQNIKLYDLSGTVEDAYRYLMQFAFDVKIVDGDGMVIYS